MITHGESGGGCAYYSKGEDSPKLQVRLLRRRSPFTIFIPFRIFSPHFSIYRILFGAPSSILRENSFAPLPVDSLGINFRFWFFAVYNQLKRTYTTRLDEPFPDFDTRDLIGLLLGFYFPPKWTLFPFYNSISNLWAYKILTF